MKRTPLKRYTKLRRGEPQQRARKRQLDWSNALEKVITEGRCRNCRASHLKLDAAHIISRAQSQDSGYVAPERIVPLCRECHQAYDTHKLDLLPVLSLVEQARAVHDAEGLANAIQRITSTRQHAR